MDANYWKTRWALRGAKILDLERKLAAKDGQLKGIGEIAGVAADYLEAHAKTLDALERSEALGVAEVLRTVDPDAVGCEMCGKSFSLEDCHSSDDGWICKGCIAKWQAEVASCQHEWSNQDGAPQACNRCGVLRDDMNDPQSAPPEERTDA